MILRVRIEIRVPSGFLAENHSPFDDGSRLAVTAAQVESDTATVQMTPERNGASAFRREVCAVNHFEWVIEHALAHEV